MKYHQLRLMLALWLIATAATAQTFTTLKSFGILTNITGFYPNAPLVQGPDGTLYGTTSAGESNVRGTVFRMQPDGSGFAVLKWFTNNLEGAEPYAGLTLSGGTLYGVTSRGGSLDVGTVFKLGTNGTGFAVLKEFTYADGAQPYVGVTLAGSVLYGTTTSGGSSGNGTVFKLNTDGTGFTVLKDYTGSDGAIAYNITVSGSLLYGATMTGGSSGNGTIFQMNTDGTSYTVLMHFAGTNGEVASALTLSGNVLYGATYSGGISGNGAVFKLNTDGTGFTMLKEFSATTYYYTNSDGAKPGPVILSGGVLYGATSEGGDSGVGTVFKLNTDGTGFAVLKHFVGNDAYGHFGLLVSDTVLFGATQSGGAQNGGTVFRLNVDGTGHAILKDFKGDIDAKEPSGLTLSGNDLYGTTVGGGTNGTGTVFKLNTAGTEYKVLKEFGEITFVHSSGIFTNGEGFEPAAVIADGSVLYGTARRGGSSGSGTVFRMNTDGSGFTVLKSFSYSNPSGIGTNSDGAYPSGALALSGNVLYGTTSEGGISDKGTVFKLNTDGLGFTVLKHFTGSDGAFPYAGLTLSGNVIYGTTSGGSGSVFKLNSDGTGFELLKTFAAISDGAQPYAGLTLSGSVLYGTTTHGGGSGDGTIFKLNTDGTGFTVLKYFAGSDGSWPFGGLTLSGSALYGTTWSGGLTGEGTIFRIDTNGSNYRVLKSLNYFDLNYTMGLRPKSTMILLDGALYGATSEGGIWNRGTVFKLDLSIPLTIQRVNNAAVLSWNAPWFLLQSAPAATGTYTNIPGATSPHTNAVVGPQQFFRLIGN